MYVPKQDISLYFLSLEILRLTAKSAAHCREGAKMGVQSARFFAESISKPLHLTNCHLYMRSGMDHAFPIFPCFDKVIKPVLGSFPRFCPQLSFEQGCGVPPNYS